MVYDARKSALHILNTLDKGRQTLDSILEEVLSKETLHSRKDRALLQALVYGVLRWRARLDWIIEYFSKTRLSRVDPKVLNILRLGLFQIIYLSRVPVSAAVNTSVEMAKSEAAPWVVGYVNGLLRNAVREHQRVSFPDIDKDAVLALATTKSFPKWLIKRWLDQFGLQETGLLCDAINIIPPITVRTNMLKTSRDKLAKSLAEYAVKIEPTNYSPDGIYFSNPKTSIPEIKAFKDGLFQVQDEAAQLVTLLLNPQPGEAVLDACAGLGGKTGHIGQMMKNQGQLLAVDKDNKKLLRLDSEMHRLGISIVTTCTHDLTNPLNQKRFGKFDRILLDAPCSGLGVLRRNPDTKWIAAKQNLEYYQKIQALFLDNLVHLVKPSGLLVYAVCSTEPEENESVVKGFLNKHAEFAIEKNLMGLPFKSNSLVNENGYLKTFPHLNSMDGFFAVCLKRIK
ncbi:MAG: 16S rRNA (cytosine(967)-C(5))-methyltransferase [Desulfobacterales bacterium PC51MH44]|nr:MAG: 16S rRNA (cytosine(967)-C(5))-methyltransferase [Desulfobacterales bacterium PC51MH44]